jgi:hypothetical protein
MAVGRRVRRGRNRDALRELAAPLEPRVVPVALTGSADRDLAAFCMTRNRSPA